MLSHFENCPAEIVENIVERLRLKDIRRLRRTCRSLASKASQTHFGSFFKSCKVYTNRQSLKRFVDVTQPGRAGLLVENIALSGDSDDPRECPADAELLQDAFKQLASARDDKKPLSLSVKFLDRTRVQSCVTKRNGAEDVALALRRHRIAWLLRTVIQALSASGLRPTRLQLFASEFSAPEPTTSFDELGRLDLDDQGLRFALSKVRVFRMHLSDDSLTTRPSVSSPGQMARLETATTALSRLLQLFRCLKVLQIGHERSGAIQNYLPPRYDANFREQSQRIWREVAASEHLPTLDKCFILDAFISEPDMLRFLERTKPRDLWMDKTDVASDSLKDFFHFFNHSSDAPTTFVLCAITCHHKRVWFGDLERSVCEREPWQPKFPIKFRISSKGQPVTIPAGTEGD